MATCPGGHVLAMMSFATLALKCDLGNCARTIRRGEAHPRCEECDYDVCNGMHELAMNWPRRPARPGVTNRGGRRRFRQLTWQLHRRQHRRSASLSSRPRTPSSRRSSARPVQLAHVARNPGRHRPRRSRRKTVVASSPSSSACAWCASTGSSPSSRSGPGSERIS